MTILKFQKTILEWYAKNGRHDLPWRPPTHKATARHSPPTLKLRRDGTYDPYKILLSEVMLQQTQVDRVIAYYKAFLKVFPTIRSLAEASPAEVLTVWKGLGYNRRALNLQRAAQMIVRDFRGHFPCDVEIIEKLPGVGPYTARAVSVFAFNQPHTFIETNIRRVFIYFFFSLPPVIPNALSVIPPVSFVIPSGHRVERGGNRGIYTRHNATQIPPLPSVGRNDSDGGHDNRVSDADLLLIIEKALYRKNPRLWYSALMDYGALALGGITNPNRRSRHYVKQSRFEGSRRYARAKIIDFLLKNKKATLPTLQKYFLTDPHLEPYSERDILTHLLKTLHKEGFIESNKSAWFLIANP